jgi:hypothetical protein
VLLAANLRRKGASENTAERTEAVKVLLDMAGGAACRAMSSILPEPPRCDEEGLGATKPATPEAGWQGGMSGPGSSVAASRMLA